MVKKAILNEHFFFRLAIPDTKGDKTKLIEKITEELTTKPEIQISVWADGHNGQFESLGTCRVELCKIQNKKFVDRKFVDSKTRRQITFQTRVLYETGQLVSSFRDKHNPKVEMQIYFQQELPYPDVDLSILKGSSLDKYPACFEKDNLMFREESKNKDIQTGIFYRNY